MATKAAVWIDHKQAVVVLLKDAGQEIKKIKADVAGGSGSKNKYTPNDFISEDKRERKVVGDRKKFYDGVIACLLGTKAVLVVGPGEAKGEFVKHITSKKLGGVTVEHQTADKMTERQLAAKAVEHFNKAAPSKTAAPKKTAKKVAKAQPAKANKKSGKAGAG